jgi:membrane fusion protein, multidrug efflux system
MFNTSSRVLTLLCLVLPWGWLGCGGGGGGDTAAPAARPAGARAPQAVEVTTVQRRDLQETLNLVGSLAANESAEIRPELAGVVRHIHFAEGGMVRAGDPLLQLDDTELQAQLAQVEARFELARLNVERSGNLSETRTIPQSEFDRARSEFAAAEAERRLVRTRLDRTLLRAPFDGIAGARTISPGDYLTPSTVITVVNDLSRLKVDFQVPERFLAKVRPGSMVTASVRSTLTGEDRSIHGRVYFVSATIDRLTRSFEVKALLEDPDPALRPGMFANITLVLEEREGVLTVPEGALLADARGLQVILVKERDGRPVADYVRVRTGLRTRGLVEIEPLGGEIPDGTQVVASGVGALILFPGAPLDPRPLRDSFMVTTP